MKNIALSLVLALFLTACSSGSSETPIPTNVTSQFSGRYQSNNNLDRGTATIDLFEAADGLMVIGNLIFQTDPGVINTLCLRNTTVASSVNNGFNLNIQGNPVTVTIEFADEDDIFTIVTTTTPPDNPDTDIDESVPTISTSISRTGVPGTQQQVLPDGTVIETVTTREDGDEGESADFMGSVNMQLAISNEGNTLSGTYVVDGNLCSKQTGAGTITLNRVG